MREAGWLLMIRLFSVAPHPTQAPHVSTHTHPDHSHDRGQSLPAAAWVRTCGHAVDGTPAAYCQGARFDPNLPAENYVLYCANLIDSVVKANDMTRITILIDVRAGNGDGQACFGEGREACVFEPPPTCGDCWDQTNRPAYFLIQSTPEVEGSRVEPPPPEKIKVLQILGVSHMFSLWTKGGDDRVGEAQGHSPTITLNRV